MLKKEEKSINNNPEKLETVFFNENDFDFSDFNNQKLQLKNFQDSHKTELKKNYESVPQVKNDLINFNDIFSQAIPNKNDTTKEMNNITHPSLNPDARNSNNAVKTFNFDDKFSNQIDNKIPRENCLYNEGINKQKINNNLNNVTTISSNVFRDNDINSQKQSKVNGENENDFKKKLIDSNLVDFNNLLGNLLFNIDFKIKTRMDSKNSVFYGTPLNQIQINKSSTNMIDDFNFDSNFKK